MININRKKVLSELYMPTRRDREKIQLSEENNFLFITGLNQPYAARTVPPRAECQKKSGEKKKIWQNRWNHNV